MYKHKPLPNIKKSEFNLGDVVCVVDNMNGDWTADWQTDHDKRLLITGVSIPRIGNTFDFSRVTYCVTNHYNDATDEMAEENLILVKPRPASPDAQNSNLIHDLKNLIEGLGHTPNSGPIKTIESAIPTIVGQQAEIDRLTKSIKQHIDTGGVLYSKRLEEYETNLILQTQVKALKITIGELLGAEREKEPEQ